MTRPDLRAMLPAGLGVEDGRARADFAGRAVADWFVSLPNCRVEVVHVRGAPRPWRASTGAVSGSSPWHPTPLDAILWAVSDCLHWLESGAGDAREDLALLDGVASPTCAGMTPDETEAAVVALLPRGWRIASVSIIPRSWAGDVVWFADARTGLHWLELCRNMTTGQWWSEPRGMDVDGGFHSGPVEAMRSALSLIEADYQRQIEQVRADLAALGGGA